MNGSAASVAYWILPLILGVFTIGVSGMHVQSRGRASWCRARSWPAPSSSGSSPSSRWQPFGSAGYAITAARAIRPASRPGPSWALSSTCACWPWRTQLPLAGRECHRNRFDARNQPGW